eukprot:7386344-Prymnesium_polylepis.1
MGTRAALAIASRGFLHDLPRHVKTQHAHEYATRYRQARPPHMLTRPMGCAQPLTELAHITT